jgi:hypothetical protein
MECGTWTLIKCIKRIHRVRNTAAKPKFAYTASRETCKKSTLLLRGWNSKNHQSLWWSDFIPVFTLLSFLLKPLKCCYIYFHCSYMYCYYDSSQALCNKFLKFNISYPYLNAISLLCGYHWFEVERGVWGWKEAQRQGEHRVPLWICSWAHVLPIFSCFGQTCYACKNRMHKTLDLRFFRSLRPNSKLTNFQVLINSVYFPSSYQLH